MTSVHSIGWYGIARQAIPGVMVGMEAVGGAYHDRAQAALSGGADAAVAFLADQPATRRLPCLVVIPDGKVVELLSWLHTFSPETFPLSQYCRVLVLSDWDRLGRGQSEPMPHLKRYAWSSLIAGEMLGQAEAIVPAGSVPFNWANGCYSYSLAKTVMLYGLNSTEITALVAERLGRCEADAIFQRKRIAARTLSYVWPHTAQREHVAESNPSEVIHAVVSSISPKMGLSLRANSSLSSSSAEKRVIGFDDAADEAMMLAANGSERQGMGAMLAGAALLVGSGTSHIDLLGPYSRECPEAYAWFGLLAGLSGPRTWDAPWLRLAKGVDRLLISHHELTDVPQADLSWVEYDWLSKLSGAMEEYARLPKQNSRSLTVELFPGTTCQFRLGSGASLKIAESTGVQAPNSIPEGRGDSGSPAAASQLEKARKLLAEAHSLLVSAGGAVASSMERGGQEALFRNHDERGEGNRRRGLGKRASKSGEQK